MATPRAAAELTPEDALRLNVLLAGGVDAVRIDESARVLHALTTRGEAKVALHPAGRSDRYFSAVRELLGGHALGSPGGYPVHLRRWTRMGQASPQRLAALLKLGDPEAVTAVAHAPNLTDELARRAWWALPTIEVARGMLLNPEVARSDTGHELSAFLVEHLPFEADPIEAMHSVRAVIGAGRLDAESRRQLWAKGKRRPHYLIGFLESAADDLPEPASPRALPPNVDGPWGDAIAREFSAMGQAWARGMQLALDKPPAHEAVYLLIGLIRQRFCGLRELAPPPALAAALPAEVEALRALAAIDDKEATAILVTTTAVGPLLRRKLAPVLDPLLGHLRRLAP